MVVGLGAVIGHTYPVFAEFKGGKAVATSAGVLLAYNPLFFLFCATLFLVILYFSRMVSFSSVLSLIIISFTTLVIKDWILTLIAFALMLFILFRHRENIKRIKNGTESKVPFGFKYKKEKENQ